MSEEREQRNQAPAHDPRIQATSMSDQVKADFGVEVPVETVPLPSGGKVYPTMSSLHGRETVEIRAMTSREEDILSSAALMKKGTLISELIRACLIDRSINPRDLVTGDRNALMVAIRITGYGVEYSVEVVCNECQNKSPRTFDLSQLPIQRLGISPVQVGMNLFEFMLPYTKKAVRFRFMTGGDEEEIQATSEKQKKLQLQSEQRVTTNLLHTIVSIDGTDDRGKISNFIRMMPARDSLALRSYIRDNEPGISMKQEVECPQCGHSEETSMPLGTNFLWPGAK